MLYQPLQVIQLMPVYFLFMPQSIH